MDRSEILKQLSGLVSDLLDHENLVLKPETVADDVEGWDSMANVRIVVATEQKFGVRFSTSEITSLKSVGELVSLVQKHQNT
jgi:acyl carrier protein